MDHGKKLRLDLLSKDAHSKIITPLELHLWNCEILQIEPIGEYLIIQITKGDIQFKLGFLYSCATDNLIYKKLDKEVDLIVLNGSFYHLESYAFGISKEVIEVKNIQTHIVAWNTKASDGKKSLGGQQKPIITTKEFNNTIQSEEPINQIWSRIRQFKTKGLAEKLIIQRYEKENIPLEMECIKAKAIGLAFCVKNGCDYFENAKNQKSNQRIISLYYGAIAFASAEMLASPNGPKSLHEVENMTKFGHGLHTQDSIEDNAFEGFIVGILYSGFFKNWLAVLGHDISKFPQSKPKKPKDIDLSSPYLITLIELFSHIPELEDLLGMVSSTPTNWLNFNYDIAINNSFGKTKDSTYIHIRDRSGSKTIEDLERLDLPLEQIEYVESDSPGLHFKALIRHSEDQNWYSVIKQHRSPFTATSYILPIFGSVNEYRCITVVILYALSILVRYRPSIWLEVVSGKHENYLTLTEEFLSIYERLAPQQFLEALLDQSLNVVQPGSLFSSL